MVTKGETTMLTDAELYNAVDEFLRRARRRNEEEDAEAGATLEEAYRSGDSEGDYGRLAEEEEDRPCPGCCARDVLKSAVRAAFSVGLDPDQILDEVSCELAELGC